MSGKTILGIGKAVSYVGGCLGIGILCGVTAFPAFKETLGYRKPVKINDLDQAEVEPDDDFEA